MRRYTVKGRVVYDRPEHPFSFRDFVRVGAGLGTPLFKIQFQLWKAILDLIDAVTADNPGAARRLDWREIFGKISARSVGASIVDEEKRYRVMVLIMEEEGE